MHTVYCRMKESHMECDTNKREKVSANVQRKKASRMKREENSQQMNDWEEYQIVTA